MFIDELTISAKAGDGGDGVVRWRQEKFKPKGGPAGGNGGNGGDVYFQAVSDINRLQKYVGNPEFYATNGTEGKGLSQHGKNAEDLIIPIPVGSVVTDTERERKYSFTEVGELVRVLKGGRGGLGNEYFKSSTNRTPTQAQKGKAGESATFQVEVALIVNVGLVGLPNAGKSSLLNLLTNAKAKVGDYPFTTTTPHLGAYYDYTIADIPGLVEGASTGKGLGHRFLRHAIRTKMLLHLVSLESESPLKDYYTIRKELSSYDTELKNKDEWVVLTKKDLVDKEYIEEVKDEFDKIEKRVFVTSINDAESIKFLNDALAVYLKNQSLVEESE